MAVPTNFAEAMALLTAALPENPISGLDVREVVTWLYGLSNVETGEVPVPLVLRNQALTANGVGPLILARARTGHVANTTTTIEVTEYTHTALFIDPSFEILSLATGLPFVATDFDESARCVVTIHYGSGRAWGSFQVLERDVLDAPSVLVCLVPKADTDTLEIRSDGMYFETLPTIVPSVGAAVTVSGIKSFTPTRCILQLSRTILLTDVFDVVFAADSAFSLRGIPLPAQSIAFFWHTLPTALPGFTSYRDASVAIANDGTWPFPAGVTDAVSWLQLDAGLQPPRVVNGYEGAPVLRFAPLACTFDIGTDEITTGNIPHGITAIDTRVWFAVQPDSGGTVPTGMFEYTTYYARDLGIGPTKLRISATPGGAAIDFTGSSLAGVLMFSDKLASVTQINGFTTTTQDTCWMACVPRMITRTVAVGFNKDHVLGGQGYWGISVDAGAAPDDFLVGAIEYTGTGDDKIETACQEGTPMLACRTHGGGNMTIAVDRKPAASTASGVVTTTTAQLSIGCRSTDAGFTNVDVMALCTTNVGPHIASDVEGMQTFSMLEPWGSFLRHDVIDVLRQSAVVGVPIEVFWSQVHRVANGNTQYNYEITGVGGVVFANRWTWTPVVGDIGSHTATLKIKLGTRLVTTRTFTVDVVAATTTGTRRILIEGDSWTNGGVWPIALRDALIAQGNTVVMMGTRGGFNCTFNPGTDAITLNGHGFVSGDQVRFCAAMPAGSLPTAVGGDLAEGVFYFVLVIDGNSFRIERTLGGGAIDITSAGVGISACVGPNQSNEGRSGWTWDDFFYGLRPSVVGTSPMIDPATGLYSWAYYIANKLGGVVPTDVIHQKGINGIATGAATYSINHNDPVSVQFAIDYICAVAEREMRTIRLAQPATRQYLVVPSMPSSKQSFARAYQYTINADEAARSFHKLARRFVSQFGGRQAEGYHLLSLQNIDPATDFADFLHCSTGYPKFGTAAASTIRLVAG